MPRPTTSWFETRDGRRLAVDRRGSSSPGTPTVVFEAGMAASHAMWGAVVPLVAERTATVAYDRSGLGASPADDRPRSLARLSDDLVDVLGQVDGPVVLVAHSWGGPVARVAASQVPDRIAGLVLVDQTDEGCALYFRDGFEQKEQRFATLLPLLARVGAIRLFARRLAKHLPPEDRKALVADGSVASARTHQAELATCNADLRGLRDQPVALPDVPTTWITGTKPSRISGKQRACLRAAHVAAAEAAPQGRQVDAPESGHMVPFTEPALVAGEVLRVVDLVVGSKG
jgi:pimeloyl-ACP methyl ester carboxylesterase